MNGDESFLSRWSRLKREARDAPAESPREQPAPPAASGATAAVASTAPQPAEEPASLPSVEALTPQSDFTGFMKPEVDPALRRQALKTLFQDPQFNVMDGLDVYIDDYTKADPIPEGWLAKMSQVARLGAYEPPKDEPSTGEPAQEVAAAPRAEPEASAKADPPPSPPASPESETG